MREHTRRAAAVAAALVGFVPASAHAGGILIPGFGPTSTGRAGAFVASADDPSAIGVNPAGLAKQKGTVLLFGTVFIRYALEFTRRGTYDPVEGQDLPWAGQPYGPVRNSSKPELGIGSFQAVPLLAVSTDLGLGVRGLRFGAGVFAPGNAYPERAIRIGYEIDNPVVAPPPSRYDIIEQKAAVVLPSLAVAYRVLDQLDLGARVSWGFGHIEAETYLWGLQNFAEWTGNDSVFSVDATDRFVPAAALGVLYRPTSSIEIGAHWTSELTIAAQGTGRSQPSKHLEVLGNPISILPVSAGTENCAGGGTEEALKGCVTIPVPMTTTLGARYVVRDAAGAERADLELDVAWERHSAASDYEVVVDGQVAIGAKPMEGEPDERIRVERINKTLIRHGFQDVLSFRLGGNYRMPIGAGTGIVRLGAAYDTATAREGWERVDLDGAARTTLALGAAYRLSRFQVDLGGGAVLEGTRDIGTGCNPTNDKGCDGTGTVPPDERTGPDPAQPRLPPESQVQSPFNEGRYKSHYVVLLLGLSTWF